MSGLEIVGVVASIVQIADLGGRLSVKLCTFCHKFKHADKALRYLSKDVALTCNVLRQLGDSLGQDDLACLYSPDAFETAQDVLKECEQVFQELDSAIEQHYPDPQSHSRIDKMTRKIKFLMNESHLDTVAGNLERLKSTMLLMLNVVIYAGQIRSRRETHELQEQRNLLLVLTSEKIESERNYEMLTRTLQFTSLTETSSHMKNSAGVDQSDESKDELYHYCQMVKSVLHDINTVQSLLDRDRYRRVRNGFISLHKSEASVLLRTHGRRAFEFFRSQSLDSFRLDSNCGPAPAQPIKQLDHSQQSPISPSQALSQEDSVSSSSNPPETSELSRKQVRDRAMQAARELQISRQAQQALGQHDASHVQSHTQTLRTLQARARQLQQEQLQSLMQSRLASQAPQAPQAPPMPNMEMSGIQRDRQPVQQQQRQAQTMQASVRQQMQQSPAHLMNMNELSNQSYGLHRPVQPDPFKPRQPDPAPQYENPGRPPYQAPTYEIPPHAQSPLKPTFSQAQSSESNVEESSTGFSASKESAFSLDFSALDNPRILECFDFDKFLFGEDKHTEPSKSDQVISDAASSQYEKKDFQPGQPTARDTDDSVSKRASRKRKVSASSSTDDKSKSQAIPDSTKEEGKSKRIRSDSSSSGDESSSTVLSPPTVSAGTETQNLPSAATDDQSSASDDAPIKILDAWILRWTKLEETELKV
ncbi:hypothetical protein F1880_005148 [Penicillium rolfsii]|nr:hypothetical protein F1880_005148 [Penicillium rolfsii]